MISLRETKYSSEIKMYRNILAMESSQTLLRSPLISLNVGIINNISEFDILHESENALFCVYILYAEYSHIWKEAHKSMVSLALLIYRYKKSKQQVYKTLVYPWNIIVFNFT